MTLCLLRIEQRQVCRSFIRARLPSDRRSQLLDWVRYVVQPAVQALGPKRRVDVRGVVGREDRALLVAADCLDLSVDEEVRWMVVLFTSMMHLARRWTTSTSEDRLSRT